MRAASSSSDTLFGFLTAEPINATGLIIRWLEGSDMEQLEREFQALLAEIVNLNETEADPDVAYTLLYIDFAGGGDGEKFMLQVIFGDTKDPSTFIADGGLVVGDEVAEQIVAGIFFEGQSLPELLESRQQAWARLPSVNPIASGQSEYVQQQVMTAGASQGLRYAGLVLTTQTD